jgi:NADH-quinone oxidoreductase subunit N
LELNPGLKGIFSILILASLVALGIIYIQDQIQKFLAEFYALMLMAMLGMFFIIFSKHMMLTFIALELMSLSVYILVSLKRTNAASAEAGFKYFILGGLAACFILYGMVLLFGATGTFNFALISQNISQIGESSLTLAKVGGVLVLCGLLFKVGAFPFHSWVPDVYQGSPASLSGWMSTIVKMASFVLLVKFSLSVFFTSSMINFFSVLISICAVLTMFAGNLLALQQFQLKRLFAYSSVAHTGYILVALVAAGSNPKSLMTLFMYLTTYSVLSLTSFGVLAIWENNRAGDLTIDHIAGIGKSEKIPALFFALASLGLAGIPLTAGFIGKLLLVNEAMSGRQAILCVMLVIASLIGAYYYLRLFYHMYLKPSFERTPLSASGSFAQWTPVLFLTLVNVFMGIAPQIIVSWLAGTL